MSLQFDSSPSILKMYSLLFALVFPAVIYLYAIYCNMCQRYYFLASTGPATFPVEIFVMEKTGHLLHYF